MGRRFAVVAAIMCASSWAHAQPIPKGVRDLSGTYTAVPVGAPPTRPFEFFDRDFDVNWSQNIRDQLILGRTGQEREGNVLRIF